MISDWPDDVGAVDDHFPYSQSYHCQRYCCMTIRRALTIRRRVAGRPLMTMNSAMAIVVDAILVAASDSFDRKRSFDFDPFPQITPTFLLCSLSFYSLFQVTVSVVRRSFFPLFHFCTEKNLRWISVSTQNLLRTLSNCSLTCFFFIYLKLFSLFSLFWLLFFCMRVNVNVSLYNDFIGIIANATRFSLSDSLSI